MSKVGFTLKRLRVTGPDVKPAEVILALGLNVISGPSDVGKSWILQAIDYMLGASEPPKEIPEARDYTTILLEIRDRQDNAYTLQRDLIGGGCYKYDCSIADLFDSTPKETLSAKAGKGNRQSISGFLLSLCNVSNARVRANERNKTVNLSFRHLCHLFIIDEEQVISKKSLVTYDSAFDKTAVKSAFNFLLSRTDDHDLVPLPDPKIVKTQNSTRLDIYSQLIQDIETKAKSIEQICATLPYDYNELQSMISQTSEMVTQSGEGLSGQIQKRRDVWNCLKETESRLIVLNELLARFDLLKQHYTSDLARLDFIDETNAYFEQLKLVKCPLCGKTIDTDSCLDSDAKATIVDTSTYDACRREVDRTHAHLVDLENTVSTLQEERLVRIHELTAQQQDLEELDKQISGVLKPQVLALKSQLDQLIEMKGRFDELEFCRHYLNELQASRIALLEESPEHEKAEPIKLPIPIRQQLTDSVRNTLQTWDFPSASSVEFDGDDMDFIIGGIKRKSHGKGYRAVAYSAFAIGLMRYCYGLDRPHPGFVVIDSPLTTFKEGSTSESGSEVPGEIQTAFWADLAELRPDMQVVILENKVPSIEIREQINYVEFVGNKGNGRKGFFPD